MPLENFPDEIRLALYEADTVYRVVDNRFVPVSGELNKDDYYVLKEQIMDENGNIGKPQTTWYNIV
jgi:hypothetical protein